MIRHFFLTILRNLLRNKLNGFINILGLALGIATGFLILTHVRYEMSYDRFYPKSDRLYRVISEARYGDQTRKWAPTAPLLADEILHYFPEVENATHFSRIQSLVLTYQAEGQEPVTFTEYNGFFTDASAIDMFDIEIIRGNPESVLSEVNSIIITPEMAQKYYGDSDPIGKTLLLEGRYPFTVRGVFREFPEATHLRPEFLLDFQSFRNLLYAQDLGGLYEARTWAGVYTYVLLKEEADADQVVEKLPDFAIQYYQWDSNDPDFVPTRKFSLQPITSIHLHSQLEQEIGRNGNIVYIIVFSITALFILFIAGVNFVNIATAQSFKRMKEVAVRKISGARKAQLIRQFTGEATILTLIAGLLGVLLIDFMIPLFNRLSGKSLDISQVFSLHNILIMVGIILGLGILAGLYPAVFASNFNPTETIKGIKDPRSRSTQLRKILLVVQFILAGFLIFSTLVVYQQIRYFNNKNMGFQKENLVAVLMNGNLATLALENPSTLKEAALSGPMVLNASIVSNLPGKRYSVEGLEPDSIQLEGDLPSMRFMRADEDFISTLGLELVQGKDYKELNTLEHAFILNETAVAALNLKKPIGMNGRSTFGEKGEIIGVVKDFHFASLHQEIEPMVIEYFRPDQDAWRFGLGYLLVRIQDGLLTEGIDYLRSVMIQLESDAVFNYEVLESNLENLYQDENNVLRLFKAFSLLSIFIACLGLFGISAFTAELRTKEIGIRKSFGASLILIVRIISMEFMGFVMVALIIALPAGWYLMHRWLQNFAFHINIYWWLFILSAIITIGIAWIAVSYQAIRAGLTHPAQALRYE
jgi:putative ABC transport system permease protein